MRTKKLTISQYGSPFFFNSKAEILKLVNREANIEWGNSMTIQERAKHNEEMGINYIKYRK